MSDGSITTLQQARARIRELEKQNEALRTQLNTVYDKEPLRLFFDLGLVGMTLTSLEKGWLMVNQRLCDMLGYTHDEMVTKTWADLTHPEDLEEDVRLFESVLAGERDGYQMDKRYLRKDGSVLFARIDVKCVRDRDGKADKFIGMIADISDLLESQQELEESKKRLDLAINGAELGLWDWNIVTGETFFSDNWYEITGYQPNELINHISSWESVIHPEDSDAVYDILDAHLKGRTPGFKAEHRIIRKDGDPTWVLDVGKVFEHDADGNPTRAVGIYLDITSQKMAEEAMVESETTMKAMSEASHDALIMLDDQGLISFWSQAAERIFGWASNEALGQNLHDLIALSEDARQAHKGMKIFAKTGKGPVIGSIMEFTARHKHGHTFPVERTVSSFRLRGRWYAVGTLRDITKRVQSRQQLLELARTDGLTGLNNRKHFFELAEREVIRAARYGSPLTVLMIDLDHFKRVNDTYGHDAGDAVLRHFSQLMSEAMRDADILGRYGGEEFIVLMPQTDASQGREAGERLRKLVEESPTPWSGGSIHHTASIGLASSRSVLALENLIKKADEAMYQAKHEGRNRVMAAE